VFAISLRSVLKREETLHLTPFFPPFFISAFSEKIAGILTSGKEKYKTEQSLALLF
jgi:hypothetical protein